MKAVRAFLLSAAVLLLLTAVAKIVSASGNGRILLQIDPITGLQFRYLLYLVGGLEIGVILVIIFGREFWFRTALLAWLATSFLFYRFGLLLTGYHKPCGCLGNITDALHISPKNVDVGMKVILFYLLFGSYASLFWIWKQKRRLVLGAPLNDKTVGSNL